MAELAGAGFVSIRKAENTLPVTAESVMYHGALLDSGPLGARRVFSLAPGMQDWTLNYYSKQNKLSW